MDVKTSLSQGIACARAGKREEARTILLQVVEADPKNLSAWLWLSDLVDDPQDRIIALENALIINPQQTQVRSRLEQFKKEIADQAKKQAPAAPANPDPVEPQPQANWYETDQSQSPVGLADQFMADLLRSKEPASEDPVQTRTSSPDQQIPQDDHSGSYSARLSTVTSGGPEIDPGLARLGEFSPRLSEEQKAKSANRLEVSLKQAREALEAGNQQEGIDLLHQVVWNEPENEAGWLLLSRSSFEMEEKVEALSKAIRLNPQNQEAKKQLDQWAPLLINRLDLGRWYQRQGDLDRALQAFMRASMEAHSVAIKTEADRSIIEIKRRINEPQIKTVPPTWIIFRLSVGPVLLYLLLIFIQGGLNIMTLDPILVLGVLFVIPGSIFLAISTTRPTLPSWVPIFRALGEKHEGLVHFLVGAISVILLILPYSVLILNAVARLELMRLANP